MLIVDWNKFYNDFLAKVSCFVKTRMLVLLLLSFWQQALIRIPCQGVCVCVCVCVEKMKPVHCFKLTERDWLDIESKGGRCLVPTDNHLSAGRAQQPRLFPPCEMFHDLMNGLYVPQRTASYNIFWLFSILCLVFIRLFSFFWKKQSRRCLFDNS